MAIEHNKPEQPEHKPGHQPGHPDFTPDRPDTKPVPPKPPLPRNPPKPAPHTEGPDTQSAAPIEGRPVVQTDHGPLDRETVYANRVGGTGSVTLQHDPMDAPVNPAPMGGDGASKVVDDTKPTRGDKK